MSGRADSEPPAEPAATEDDTTDAAHGHGDPAGVQDGSDDPAGVRGAPTPHDPDGPDDPGDPAGDARRARWTAAGTGVLLALAGLAAALLRLGGPVPPLVPAAYALGAAVCAVAAVLGAGGRTRRALWLLIAGAMVMALGDQFD
jgi:hypothetical protein